MSPVRRDWLVLGLLVAAVLVLLSLLTLTGAGVNPNYLVGVVLIMAIYALFCLGLNLEFGYTGLLNFGHVLSMLLGAYTVALLVPRLEGMDPSFSSYLEGWSVGGLLACLLLSALAGLVVGLPVWHASRPLLDRWVRRARSPLLERLSPHAGWSLAALLAALAFLALFPLGSRGAENAVVALAIIAGVGLAALSGYLLGLPALRLRDDYLAIVTIGAAEIVRSVAVNEEWLTRGTLGIQRLRRPVVDWALSTPWWNTLADAIDVRPVALAHALLAVALVLLVYVFLEVLARSPWGRVLKAIREDEEVAAALGKNVQRYKLQALMIGSGIGALAGILLVWHLSNVYPEHFLPIVTFYAFIIVIVGGTGNHRGTLAGAVLVWGVFELAGSLSRLEQFGIRDVAGPPQGILVGLLIILVVRFRPQGVLGRRKELLYAR